VYRYVTIIPLYAVSNIISSKSMTPTRWNAIFVA
jgi:hypothetical protein